MMDEQNLDAAVRLTDEVRAAVERFLTSQIGHPRGCSANEFLSAEGYPSRGEIKAAVDTIWDGLIMLYRLDPEASLADWSASGPFVSEGDTVWLLGGGIGVSE